MNIPDFQWEFVILEIVNLSLSSFIITLWKLLFYLICTPRISHTSESMGVGNGEWEIDSVLPHESSRELWEMGNGNLLSSASWHGPSGKWEMGNCHGDMWNRPRGKWEMGNCSAGKWIS